MAQDNEKPEETKGKGKAFFDRADEVSETGNWDFAIELYLEGIAREPGNLERGHRPLRNVALNRKAQGGKGPGFKDQIKHRAGKDPMRSLVNAEYLLAKEPGSIAYMEQVLKAAIALEVSGVVKWICDIMFEVQKQAEKRNGKVLRLVTQAYNDIEEYGSAIQACAMARELAPNDIMLQRALNELSTKYTIQKGKYGEEGDFTKSVADMQKQQDLMEKDRMAQSDWYQKQEIERAREEYLSDPTVPGKVNAFVDALLRPEDESFENEAIDVLAKAYKDTRAYQFKMRIGGVKMKQMTRRYRKLREQGNDQAAREHLQKQLQFELQEYAERAENYPTDLGVKFELGRRQLLAAQYDGAIASLQQAQRDPRRHVSAMNYLGQAFAKKGKDWLQESADTFARVLEAEMPEAREREIRYGFGDVLEQMGQLAQAQDEFSKVAQIDYNYKDVRQRLEDIRRKVDKPKGEGET